MRPITSFLLALLTLGCGASTGPGHRVIEPLVEGEDVYLIRYNPPPCLAESPELHAEVSTPTGWERVALESGTDEVDLVASALAAFGQAPDAPLRVRGQLGGRVRQWAGQHVSRVLVVLEVDPPLPDAAIDAPEAEDAGLPPDAELPATD